MAPTKINPLASVDRRISEVFRSYVVGDSARHLTVTEPDRPS